MMQSFLNVANAERANNQVVRTWVRQLRDLAFDVEDCVEFVVNLDKASRWDWVRRLTSSLICMARPPLPLDVAVAEIKRLKTMVEDVSQRNSRYNLINNDSMAHAPEQLATTADTSAFHILSQVWEAAAKKRRDIGDLKTLICSEGSDLEVISLWGSPGVVDLGGTHVIREAYNDLEICQEFTVRAWVKLMRPFNPEEFLKSLLVQFYATSSSHLQQNNNIKMLTTSPELDHMLVQAPGSSTRYLRNWLARATTLLCSTGSSTPDIKVKLTEHKYLVILEDVCTVAEWDIIKMYLRENNKGSWIVVLTQHLGLALSCTGKPYQVSELRQFSHGQSLCAFFSKVPGRRSDMSELSWQLRRGGVISVWGSSNKELTTLVDSVYTSITHKAKEFVIDGVNFGNHSWVDVPSPFKLDIFSRRLLLSFYSDDFGAKEIQGVCMMGDRGVIQWCRNFLSKNDCLVIINGVLHCNDWDLIKVMFLPEPANGSILVITNPMVRDSSLAGHCVDDEEDRVVNIKDLEADTVLGQLIKGSQLYGIGGKEASGMGRLFSHRLEEGRVWTKRFGYFIRVTFRLRNSLRTPGVTSVWGTAGAGKVPVIRRFYNEMLIEREDNSITGNSDESGFTKFSWVDVPHPFNLTDFFWRLLLDFYSDDLEAKETTAVDLMEGQDPTQECLDFICQERCLIVINGLSSTDDWESITDAFLFPEPSGSCIVIITDEESVAAYCADDNRQVFNVEGIEAEEVVRPLIKDSGYCGKVHQEASRFCSQRREDARDWATTFELVGRQTEAATVLAEHLRARVGVLSLWGISGVGKSALVRSVYSTRLLRLAEHFELRIDSVTCAYDGRFTSFSWVNVPNPFNLTEFCWRLLVDFHSDDLEAKETTAVRMLVGAQDPIQECRKFLHEECLVVIDGLHSMHDWDLISHALLPKSTKGCIIVIANEANVARHCVPDESRLVNVKGLEPDAALDLFRKVAFAGKQLSPKEIEVSNLTMAKCGRLPKVIAAIGEQCRRRTSEETVPLLESINANFMRKLEKDPRFDSLKGLFSWMQSYFDACSDALKPCIFYLSVFPADYNIKRRRLLRRWIAEGYSRDKFGISAEEDGEMLFAELVKLSIIQEPPSKFLEYTSLILKDTADTRVDLFQVNGFFHEYIMSRPMEENLVFALEGSCSPNLTHAGQHLTIRSSWDRDEIVFKSMDLSRLRSLTVFGKWMPFFICKDINMRLLRVLDLEDTTLGVTDDVLEQIGKLLPRLKFLSLRGCKDITRLPDSLGGLRQLQTLDVRHTKITMLPCAITKLVKLQYVRAGKPNVAPEPGLLTEAHEEDRIETPPVDAHGMSTSQQAARPPADGACEDLASTTLARWRSTSCSCNWLPKKNKKHKGQGLGSDNGGSVEVAATGIGNLTALHTLGVVRVSGAAGKAILNEVKKLTQLCKLGVSGINRKNWQDFCSTISCLGHLESLSVQLDGEHKEEGLCCLGDISEPPKRLKSIKLYRGSSVHVSPVWMKQLPHITKAHVEDLELTISTQEDIESLMEVPCQRAFRHLCVKPIQDGELYYGLRIRLEESWDAGFRAPFLKIDCGTCKLALVFGRWISDYVKVLVVHCSTTESSLELFGLEKLRHLEEVWLKGSYSDTVKQHLQEECAKHQNKSILKLEDQPSPL